MMGADKNRLLLAVPSAPVTVLAEAILPSEPRGLFTVQLTVALATGLPRKSLTMTTSGSNMKERVGHWPQINWPLPETMEMLCAETGAEDKRAAARREKTPDGKNVFIPA